MTKYINLPDIYGKTALHYAVANNNIELIKTLVNHKANFYIRDYKQRVLIPKNIPIIFDRQVLSKWKKITNMVSASSPSVKI